MTSTLIFAAALSNGVLLCLALCLNRRGNVAANRMLAVLVALLCWSMWNMVVDGAGLAALWKGPDYASWVTPYFWGPALLLYVRELCGKRPVVGRFLLRHMALGVGVFCGGMAIRLVPLSGGLADGFGDARLLLLYVQLLVYVYASHAQLRALSRRAHRIETDAMRARRRWLQSLIAIFAGLLLLDMVLLVPPLLRGSFSPYFVPVMLAEAAAIFAIGFYALMQSGLGFFSAADASTDAGPARPKYAGSPVDAAMATRLMADLVKIMERDRPYLDNALSLGDLSDLAGVGPHHLSQVINQVHGTNFYDFVNGYRVRRAAGILRHDAKVSITSVAFEAGFNNRVSFNNAFRKHFGTTPSQYRKAPGLWHMNAAE